MKIKDDFRTIAAVYFNQYVFEIAKNGLGILENKIVSMASEMKTEFGFIEGKVKKVINENFDHDSSLDFSESLARQFINWRKKELGGNGNGVKILREKIRQEMIEIRATNFISTASLFQFMELI